MEPTRIFNVEGRGILPTPKHGSEGQVQRVIRDVEDPATGEQRTVLQHVRPGSLSAMHAAGRVTQRQLDAGERFAQLYERAHSDGMKAIDYSKVSVDCGSDGDNQMSDNVVRSIKELERIEKRLGRGYKFVKGLVVDGKTLSQMADEMTTETNTNSKLARAYISIRLMEALDELDAYWNTFVGGGSGIRADVGEKSVVQAEMYSMADSYAHVTVEESLERVRDVTAALLKMVEDGKRKRAT